MLRQYLGLDYLMTRGGGRIPMLLASWRRNDVTCTCTPCCKPPETDDGKTTTQEALAAAPPCGSAALEQPINADVPGLSEACFCDQRPEPLGPGASKCGDYKAPEYYKYHRFSFYDAMVEMEGFRQPAPVAQRKP